MKIYKEGYKTIIDGERKAFILFKDQKINDKVGVTIRRFHIYFNVTTNKLHALLQSFKFIFFK